jgi:hypothetical protein
MKVLAIPEVHAYLEDLAETLYEKEYFSFKETARKYVIDLFDDIKSNLPTKLKRPAPSYFDQYGTDMEYAVFKKNKRTSWYVFFDIYEENEEIIYLVRYIANNHVIAQYL